jgi:hypothetical protein
MTNIVFIVFSESISRGVILKFSDIKQFSMVQFMQDSGLFKVQFMQDSGLFRVLVYSGFSLCRVQFTLNKPETCKKANPV